MKKGEVSLKLVSILVVVLIMLSAVLAYLVLRKPEESEYAPGNPPYISVGSPTNYDELDIVEWHIICSGNMKFSDQTFKLEDQHGNKFVLKAKTVSFSNFTAENLKNDTDYQLYFYDAYNLSYNTKGFMDAADEFMVKAPADGYYRLMIANYFGIVLTTNLTKF